MSCSHENFLVVDMTKLRKNIDRWPFYLILMFSSGLWTWNKNAKFHPIYVELTCIVIKWRTTKRLCYATSCITDWLVWLCKRGSCWNNPRSYLVIQDFMFVIDIWYGLLKHWDLFETYSKTISWKRLKYHLCILLYQENISFLYGKLNCVEQNKDIAPRYCASAASLCSIASPSFIIK